MMNEYTLFVNGQAYGPFRSQQAAQAEYRALWDSGMIILSAQVWLNGEFLFTIV